MASTPFSYTDPPSSTASSVKYSTPYADVESVSDVQLLSDTDSKSFRSASDISHRRNSSSSSSSSSTTTKLALISLVLSVLCVVILVLLVCCWVFLVNDGHLFPTRLGSRGNREEEVCLPCVQIGPNPLDGSAPSLLDQLDVRYDDHDLDNATQICCASTPAQFAVLFRLILQRQEAVSDLADSLDRETGKDTDVGSHHIPSVPSSAVSAHLVFKPKQTPTSETRTAEPREQQWKSPAESPMSHVRQGLRLEEKRLLVQTPGLYYIYCQLLFSPSSSSAPSSSPSSSSSSSSSGRDVVMADAVPDIASAYVRRYSILRPAAPDFLLKSRHTRHDLTRDRHSSYVGGVFRLHRGDSLYVQVSRPDLISHDDVGSFFGLFRIGD